MPALKTTLRFLALGACADVATAFGTIGRVGMDDELINVVTESTTAPSCPCDPAFGLWYCKISGQRSLQQPVVNSMNAKVLSESVAYCWNKCFKDPAILEADEWMDDGTGTCPACERYHDDGTSKSEWGCECKPAAPDYDDCNIKNADGDSLADIWYKEICGVDVQPGGVFFNALDEKFQEILPSDTVTLGSDTQTIKYNPFQQFEKFSFAFSQNPCLRQGAVSNADAPASEACKGVQTSGSKDVGTKDGCAAETAPVADCSILYYYGESWVYYCKTGTPEWPNSNHDDFAVFCSARAANECGTASDVKYYMLNEWGKYNICEVKNNGNCKMKWTGSATKPTVTEPFCVASEDGGGGDDGTSAFRMQPSTCKQRLCGDLTFTGSDPNNPSCLLY